MSTVTVKRLRAPSGNRDADRFQAVCSCGWRARATHSNRTAEGRSLAERDAEDHQRAQHA
jgi:hypothetical protein